MDYMPQFGSNTAPMQETALPQDDTLMQLDLKRKLALADALRQQQMPEGQMVSGRYVAPSFTQYLANAVDTYQGNKKEREALGQFGEYQKTKQQKQAEALKQLTGDLAGTKEINQGAYQIEVPNNKTFQTENLGGMQPIETGKKFIDVPMATTTTRAPTAPERYAALIKYGAAINDPRIMQEAITGGISQANKAEETAGERAYREKQIANEQEFQRVQMKDRQGFELTQGEKNFANQMSLQKSSQGFQANEADKQRALQREIRNSDAKAAPSGYKKNADGSLTFIPGGPADPNLKPLTQDQANARVYGERMSNSHNIINNLESDGKLKYNPIATRAIITAPAGISDITYGAASKETQSASQAMRDFINATLRRESGAAISPSEFDNAIKQYFPQPGEDKSISDQKRKNREIVINGITDAGYSAGQTRPSANKEIRVNY